MIRIVLDPEFASISPPLSPQEQQDLEDSLKRDGCREPLIVLAKCGILLDGFKRFEICARLGIPFAVREIELPRFRGEEL